MWPFSCLMQIMIHTQQPLQQYIHLLKTLMFLISQFSQQTYHKALACTSHLLNSQTICDGNPKETLAPFTAFRHFSKFVYYLGGTDCYEEKYTPQNSLYEEFTLHVRSDATREHNKIQFKVVEIRFSISSYKCRA